MPRKIFVRCSLLRPESIRDYGGQTGFVPHGKSMPQKERNARLRSSADLMSATVSSEVESNGIFTPPVVGCHPCAPVNCAEPRTGKCKPDTSTLFRSLFYSASRSVNVTATWYCWSPRFRVSINFVPAACSQKRLSGETCGSVRHLVTSSSPTFSKMSPLRMPARSAGLDLQTWATNSSVFCTSFGTNTDPNRL